MAKRQQYLYELIGTIQEKRTKKPSQKAKQKAQERSQRLDEFFYKLEIICENKPQVNKIFVFKNSLVSEKIWKDLEESNYYDKRYLFFCHNYKGLYRLVNWKELKLKEVSHD
ncbi:hypothetical protein [endosymbiont GvMRE of Glomus versiforme]|uniref:hypothetical protein n=1 Tax=endosymbiont GvMRE of Glomus versiforme TaxID=2039283 RepID=UPI000ECEFEF2|nr:hypothetical protein [endosymbiont GvMRE of Glomus versiforme]RHZ36258.1 hypothetical protein GvMRE_Ic1g39 [endosymbiont GvMRE of Glomus versiforme]